MTMRYTFITLLAGNLSLLSHAHAALPAQDHFAGATQEHFVKRAFNANELMIRAGQLAEIKAVSPAVRRLGRIIAADHRRLQEELEPLAYEHGLSDSPELKGSYDEQWSDLANLGGRAFDRAFVNIVIRDHKCDLVQLQKARATQPAKLGKFIDAELPTLRRHLQMAQEVSQELNARSDAREKIGKLTSFAKASGNPLLLL